MARTARGTTVHARFDPEQVASAYVNWSEADRRVNLELFAPEVRLSPGKSQVLEQVYLFGE